jgi:hypothetical protein
LEKEKAPRAASQSPVHLLIFFSQELFLLLEFKAKSMEGTSSNTPRTREPSYRSVPASHPLKEELQPSLSASMVSSAEALFTPPGGEDLGLLVLMFSPLSLWAAAGHRGHYYRK